MLTFQKVKNNPQILEFLRQTDLALAKLEYTDHGLRHAQLVADRARTIALETNLTKREQELAAIAGFCHDMGNFLGRTQHHYWAALLFSQVFLREVKNPAEITTVMQAIVNHDKATMKIFNNVSAVVVLADKSDVHRSRVRIQKKSRTRRDIHDRVNFAVTDTRLSLDKIKKEITLKLKVDTTIIALMEYFEIFTARMAYCRQAARHLGYKFSLEINKFKLL